MGRAQDDENTYRLGHSLAQRVVEYYRKLELAPHEVVFDYSGTLSKISIIENLKGKSGWLRAVKLRVSSIDTEEHIFLSGITDEGDVIDNDCLSRFFSLKASVSSLVQVDESVSIALESVFDRQKQAFEEDISKRNSDYFDIEMQKIDKWGEDQRISLKTSIKELETEIKDLKKLARNAANLPEKLVIEKKRKTTEARLTDAERDYFASAKEIEKSKEKLISAIEKTLEQEQTEEELFVIRWKIV
jgi:hypothetical protein